MGLEASLVGAHRYWGLRSCGFGRTLELDWPEHPSFPSYGYTITRYDLDGLVAERAAKAGATFHQGTEALAPLIDGAAAGDLQGAALPECGGAKVRGSDGRAAPDPGPLRGGGGRLQLALRPSPRHEPRSEPTPRAWRCAGYYRSPRHDDPFIESHLDIRDSDGSVVPGYGWIFPLGDGRINVGVGLLSTDSRWKGTNTTRLMDAFVRWAPRSWGISPETSCGPPTGGKLPMGLAVEPLYGPNTLVVGDAAGCINPFNGEGIAYGYETGRLAAAALGRALSGEGSDAVRGYADELERWYGAYFRVGRAFVRLISQPRLMRWCAGVGMHSEPLMSQLLRIMANLMRPDVTGAAEASYRALEALSRMLPEPIEL